MLGVGALSWVWRLCSLLYFILRKSSRASRSADNQSSLLPFSSVNLLHKRARSDGDERGGHVTHDVASAPVARDSNADRRPARDQGARHRHEAATTGEGSLRLCAEPADAEWLARSATAKTNHETIRSSERAGRSLFVLWSRRPCLNRFFLFSSFSLVK